MKSTWAGFQSPIGPMIDDYLKLKRALGCRFETEDAGLRLLDRFLMENGVASMDEIGADLLDRFLCSRPRSTPRSFNQLLGILRRLFEWLVLHGHISQSPVTTRPKKQTNIHFPFIFSTDEIQQLLKAAGNSNRTTPAAIMRRATYETIFFLLTALGLRAGEVSRLQWQDIGFDHDVLVIRQSKFFKNRLVPFGPRIRRQLSAYRRTRENVLGTFVGETPVFSRTLGRAISPKTIGYEFRNLLPRLNLRTPPPGVRCPTVHSLRHTFAVRTLLHWYKSGIDPAERLLHLSTFLGHVDICSTAVYLTITFELLEEANHRFETFASPLITEGTS